MIHTFFVFMDFFFYKIARNLNLNSYKKNEREVFSTNRWEIKEVSYPLYVTGHRLNQRPEVDKTPPGPSFSATLKFYFNLFMNVSATRNLAHIC